MLKSIGGGGKAGVPVYALDAGDVGFIAGFCYRLVWIWIWIWVFLGVCGGGIFCDACVVRHCATVDCRGMATIEETRNNK